MKWNMISIGDIALRKGGSIDPKKHQDEVFELYSIPAFDAGAPEVVAGSTIGSSKKAVQPNDVMISRIVPHIRRACVVGPAGRYRQIASGEWIIFRGERIWPKYLRWLLVGDVFHSAFMRTVSGVGGSLLRARPAEVFKIQIPLPPLPEQRRIAQILDKADALRAKRRAALAQLDTLTQSVFLDMFGDPAMNPKRWPVVLLREPTARIQIGPFGSLLHQEDYVEGGIPLVNPKHIQQGVIQPDPSETVSARKFAELDTYHLQAGDVVMGRRGEMGRCAIIDDDSGPLLCGTGSLFVRPDNEHTTNLFLFFLLSSVALKARLERLSLGQTLPNLNSRIVEGLEVPLPPLAVQFEFAARVEGARQVVNAQRKAASQLSSLFASLQQCAFRGEL